MDRSFLSHRDVVEAASEFVCARLSTYESADEGKFLASVFTGRSGQLENTVFSILAPDGETQLVRSGRSPRSLFGDDTDAAGARMADQMRAISKRYAKTAERLIADERPVPVEEDVRLGLNVASCDGLPLVVGYAADEKALASLELSLRPHAWDEAVAGSLAWTLTSSAKDLTVVGVEKDAKPGLYLIAPDVFGQEGTVLSHVPADADAKTIEAALAAVIEKHAGPEKDTRSHVARGRSDGVHWDTEIPVTDPGPRGGRRR